MKKLKLDKRTINNLKLKLQALTQSPATACDPSNGMSC